MRTPERQNYQDIPKKVTNISVQNQRATMWAMTSKAGKGKATQGLGGLPMGVEST